MNEYRSPTALINENNFDSSLCPEAARNLTVNEGLILTIFLSMTGYLFFHHFNFSYSIFNFLGFKILHRCLFQVTYVLDIGMVCMFPSAHKEKLKQLRTPLLP